MASKPIPLASSQRRSLLAAMAVAAASQLPLHALAQLGSAPVRLIVGFPPGGSSDAVARQLAEVMRVKLDRPVLVENRAGAAGRIAPEFVKSAPADGTVVLLTPNPMITQYPSVYKKLSYDPSRDLAPVAQVASYPLFITVGPAVPESVRNLKEYLEWTRQAPKNSFFASPASGSTPHFVGVMLGRAGGGELSHVPYRGDAPAVQDLLGGQVPMSITVPSAILPHIGTGKVRVLATTGARRMPELPNVPTIAELGFPALKTNDWFGTFVPPATPAPAIARLQAAIREALAASSVRESFARLGVEAAYVAADEFARRNREEAAEFANTVKAVGFTPED